MSPLLFLLEPKMSAEKKPITQIMFIKLIIVLFTSWTIVGDRKQWSVNTFRTTSHNEITISIYFQVSNLCCPGHKPNDCV